MAMVGGHSVWGMQLCSMRRNMRRSTERMAPTLIVCSADYDDMGYAPDAALYTRETTAPSVLLPAAHPPAYATTQCRLSMT